MMSKLLLALVVFVAIIATLSVLAFQYLGAVGLLLVLAGFIVLFFLIKAALGKLLERLFLTPFKAKGAVLRGAITRVHAVPPAEPPALTRPEDISDEEWEEMQNEHQEAWNEYPCAYYHIDVTITPAPVSGTPFSLWEPGELVLVHPEAKADLTASDDEDDGEIGTIEEVEVWQEGNWTTDEGAKYPGEQRLRLLTAVKPGVTQARFRYYFEVFGDVEFPQPSPDPAVPSS